MGLFYARFFLKTYGTLDYCCHTGKAGLWPFAVCFPTVSIFGFLLCTAWQWTVLIAGSRRLGLYFRTALATFLAYFVHLAIKKIFMLTRKAISWGYVSRRSWLKFSYLVGTLIWVKVTDSKSQDYIPIPNLNVFLFEPIILLFSSKIIISVVQKTQAYCSLLHFADNLLLRPEDMWGGSSASSSWVKALCFQRYLVTLWLSHHFLVILTAFRPSLDPQLSTWSPLFAARWHDASHLLCAQLS